MKKGITAWIQQMETEVQDEPYQILVGNKSDLEQTRVRKTWKIKLIIIKLK